MLDDRVRDVLARLEAEEEAEIVAGVPAAERSLAVGDEGGRLLFALVAPNAACEVLEIGASRGYSSIWLAAAARILGGRVVSLEQDPVKCEAWRRNIADAGLEEHAELVEGDALATLPRLEEGFDLVFLDAWKHGLRGALRARQGEGRPRRRGRGRQRRVARRRPCRVRVRAAERPRARLGHRAGRQRPRGDDSVAIAALLARIHHLAGEHSSVNRTFRRPPAPVESGYRGKEVVRS